MNIPDSLIKEWAVYCYEKCHKLERYKERGKGRYVPEWNKLKYIQTTYKLLLCTQLLKRKERDVDKLIAGYMGQDWMKYSFTGKAYDGKKLTDALLLKYKTNHNWASLLAYQSVYLQEASDWIINRLIEYKEEYEYGEE